MLVRSLKEGLQNLKSGKKLKITTVRIVKQVRCDICGLLIDAKRFDEHHRACDTAACEAADRINDAK